ncbi:hypothetical protein ACLX1H_011213 [Fusarium chlamydosporum]
MAQREPIIILDDDDNDPHPPPPRAPQGRRRNAPAHISFDTIRSTMQWILRHPPDVPIYEEGQLTPQELHTLAQILQSLEQHTQILVTMDDFRRMLSNAFDGWDSSCPAGHPPVFPERKFPESRIHVGILKQDHPVTDEKAKAGTAVPPHRRAGQPVYFGVGLRYETGCIDWAWRDANNAGISPQFVRLDPGKTSTSIRTEAMIRYDMAE